MKNFHDFRQKTHLLSTFTISFDFVNEKKNQDGCFFTNDHQYVILCNNIDSLASYNSKLESLFKELRNESNIFLNFYQTKGEYLIELLNTYSLISSFRKLISTEQSDNGTFYYHSKFKIDSNFPFPFDFSPGEDEEENEIDTTGIEQIQFSAYAHAILIYINEIESYLLQLKEIILTTPSNDLLLKPNVPLGPNISTQEDPLKFFDHFVLRRGFYNFKANFYPNEEEQTYLDFVEIDKNEESYTYVVYNEDGDVEERKVLFTDSLHKRLLEQYNISFSLITDSVKEVRTDRTKISTVLDLQFSKCLNILNRLSSLTEINQYEVVGKSLKAILNRLIENYKEFINPNLINQFDPKILNSFPFEKLTWNGDPHTFILLFYNHIHDGTITMDNTESQEMIYEKLVSFFKLKTKSAKKGRPSANNKEKIYLSDSTVISYFKNGGKIKPSNK